MALGQVQAGRATITAGGAVTDADTTTQAGSETPNVTTTGSLSVTARSLGTALNDVNFATPVATLLRTTGGSLYAGFSRPAGQTTDVVQAQATGGDVVITEQGGGLKVDNASATGSIALRAYGSGVTTGLSVGNLGAGGDIELLSTYGAIVQQAGTVISPGTGATTRATARNGSSTWDITLDQAGNDFAHLALDGANLTIVDRNGVDLAGVKATGSATLTVGGAITESAAASIAGALTLHAGSAAVTLDAPGNDFQGPVGGSAGAVTLVDANALVLGALTATSLTASAGTDITQASGTALAVSGASAFRAGGNMLLGALANQFGGTVSILAAQNASLGAAAALRLGASLVSGNLSLASAGGDISGSAGLTVGGTLTINDAGHDASLLGANAIGGLVVLAARKVNLADGTGIVLGNITTTGTFTLLAGGAITQQAGSAILVDGVGATASFTAQSGSGAATRHYAITLAEAGNDFRTLLATGSTLSLRDRDDLTATLAADGNASLITGGPLVLAGATVGGALGLTAGGTLTDTGALAVTGLTTLTLGGNDVVLDSGANHFAGGVAIVSAHDVTLVDAGNLAVSGQLAGALTLTAGGLLTFGATTVGGALQASAAGIGGNGPLAVTGATSFNAGTGDVLLTGANNFVGAVSVAAARNVSLTDSNALTLGAITASGTLMLSAAGTLLGNAALHIGGATTVSDAGFGVTLNAAGNHFGQGITIAAASAATLRDAAALRLAVTQAGAVSAVAGTDLILAGIANAGTLSASATAGAISQDGALNVTGAVTLGAAGGITLTGSNSFGGTLAITGAQAVRLTTRSALTLGNVTASGDVVLIVAGTIGEATGSAIQLAAGKVLRLRALANGVAQDITLQGAANRFDTVVLDAVRDARLTDSTGLSISGAARDLLLSAGGLVTLAGLALSRDLSVATSSGGIGESAALAVAGNASFSASTGAMRLDGTNLLSGTVTLAGAGPVVLVNNQALLLGNVAIGGAVSLTAAGSITQQAGTSAMVGGTLTLDAHTGSGGGQRNQAITLDNTGNNFATVRLVAADALTLRDTNALALLGTVDHNAQVTAGGAVDLGTLSIGGNLVLGAGGAVTDSGSLAVAGDLTLNASGQTVTLDGGITLGGALYATAAALTLVDAGSLRLGTITVSGTAGFTAGGDISQIVSTSLHIGTLRLATPGDITLGNAGNALGTVHLGQVRDVVLVDSTALTLDGSVGRALDLTTGGALSLGALSIGGAGVLRVAGAVSQTGALLVQGSLGVTAMAGLARQAVTLTNTSNDLATLSVTGADVRVTDANALTIALLDASGAAVLRAGGTLLLNGTVTGASLDLGTTGDLTMAAGTRASATTGPLTITAGGDARISQIDAGTLATSLTIGGALLSQLSVADVTAGAVNLAGTGVVTLRAASIGTPAQSFLLRTGHVASATATAGDLLLAVVNTGAVAIDALSATLGAATVAATATQTTLGTVAVRDAFALSVSGGGLALNADITAQGLTIGVTGGGITMAGGRVLSSTASGTTLAAGVAVTATDSISLGRVQAVQGAISIASSGGALVDARSDEAANIITQGSVTLASATDLAVTLRADAADHGTTQAGDLNVNAGSVGTLSAGGSLSLVVVGFIGATDLVLGSLAAGQDLGIATASGGLLRLTGTATAGRDATLTVGSGGLAMTSDASVAAGRNLLFTTSGAAALGSLAAIGTLTVQAAGQAVTGLGQHANLVAGSLAVTAGSIGTQASALGVDAATLDRLTITGDAWIDLKTATAEAGTAGVALNTVQVGGSFSLTGSTASATLYQSITAATLTLDLAAGRFDMAAASVITVTGTVALTASAGMSVAQIIGDTTAGSAQLVMLASDGAITRAAGSATNIATKGTLSITAGSIGAVGTGMLQVAVARVSQLHAVTGAAYVAFSLDPVLSGVNISTALVLDVATDDLFLQGAIIAGSVQITVEAGRFVEQAGASLVSAGAVSIRASGDIDLTRISAADGNIILSTAGNILNTLADTGTNLVVTNGALGLSAANIGTPAKALVVDTPAITELASTARGVGAAGINILSRRSVTIGGFSTDAAVVFEQSSGDVTITGVSTVATLTLTVDAGGFAQSGRASVTADGDIAVTTSGDITLVDLTSLGGDITLLSSGGAILDGTPTRENALLTTSDPNEGISLTAQQIGSSATDGDIDIDTATVLKADAHNGDLRLGLTGGITLHDLTSNGTVALTAQAGDILLEGQVKAGAAQISALGGNVTMSATATLTTVNALSLAASGDITLGTVVFGGSTTSVVAGGAVIDGLGGPGTNLTGSGGLTLAGTSIGSGAAAITLSASRLASVTTTAGDAMLVASTYPGATGLILGAVNTGAGAFSLRLDTGDLTLDSAMAVGSTNLVVAAGGLGMTSKGTLAAVGNLTINTRDDIGLTKISSDSGIVSLTTSGGRVLNASGGAVENIYATGTGTSLRINARGVGTPANGGALTIAVDRLDQLLGGELGVYLFSTQALALGTVAITGPLHLTVADGDLNLTGPVSAASTIIEVRIGRLVMADAVDMTVTGDATISASSDILLSHLVVDGGALTLTTSNGDIIDNTVAELPSRPNIAVIGGGHIARLAAQAIGNITDPGAIDIAAARIDQVTARAGAAYLHLLQATTMQDFTATGVASALLEADLSVSGTTSGNSISLISNAGNISFGAGAKVTATNDLTATLAAGGFSASDGAQFSIGTALDITATGGDISFGGKAQVGAGTLALEATTGSVSFGGQASLTIGGMATIQAAQSVSFADGATAQVTGPATVTATGGDISFGSKAQLGASTLALEATTGSVSFGGQAGLTIGGMATIQAAQSVSFADGATAQVTGPASITATTGDISFGADATFQAARLDITASAGAVSFADNAEVATLGDLVVQSAGPVSMTTAATIQAGGQARVTVGLGDFSMGSRAALRAVGPVAITVNHGNLTAGSSAVLSSLDAMSLQVPLGGITLSDHAAVEAGAALTMLAGGGDVRLGTSATITAASLGLQVTHGALSLADAAAVQVGGALDAVVAGPVSLTTDARMRANGALSLIVGAGNLSLADGAMLSGGTLDIALNAGDLVNTGAATIHADAGAEIVVAGNVRLVGGMLVDIGGNLSPLRISGDLSLSGQARIDVGGDMALAVGGRLTMTEEAALVVGSGAGALVAQVAGDVALSGQAVIDVPGGALALGIARGQLTMADAAIISGGYVSLVVAAGGLTQADSSALILGSATVTITTSGTMLLNRVVGGISATLTTTGGQLLDNTAAELALVLAPLVNLSAVYGIGLPFQDLNISALVLNASAETSGGITLRGDSDMQVGAHGVVNRGPGDITLFTAGNIGRDAVVYLADRQGDFPRLVVNGIRQGVFISNTNAPFLQTEGVGAAELAYLMNPNRYDAALLPGGGFAGTTPQPWSQQWIGQNLGRLGRVEASRPIRVADADPVPERSILDLLGLDASGTQRTAPPPGLTSAQLGQRIEEQLDSLERPALNLGLGPDGGRGLATDAVGQAVRQLFQEVDAAGPWGLLGTGQPQASQQGNDPAERPQLARILAAADDGLDAPMLPGETLTLAALADAMVTPSW
jgi:hypothetical protein